MAKTYEEINEKIKKGEALVVTAEEIIPLVKEEGLKATARKVDVVTTATFGPMCSSGVFLNLGHSKPKIKIQKAWLNGVSAYAGLAAIDVYLGAAQLPEDDPLNKIFPGEFRYGGGHVIEELVAGKDVKLEAISYGTDCYPRKRLTTWINLSSLNEATLFNPRNAYQNYNVATNLSSKTIYTYMGILKPDLGNANYCSAGQLSPLLNDPYYKTIGVGTRIFLGGGIGYVAWWGTQHNPTALRTESGVPKRGGGSLALIGDLKQMKPEWLRGTSLLGYGVNLTVGIGIPIPILNEEILKYTAVEDSQIYAPIIDYSEAYPQSKPDVLGEVSYKELKSGEITIQGKVVPTASLSSYFKAVEIANTLKEWILKGEFFLSKPVQSLPGVESGLSLKPLKERPVEEVS